MNPSLSSKAQTLQSLKGLITNAQIPDFIVISASEFLAGDGPSSELVLSVVGDCPLIVRSSSIDEDTATASNAGAYLSVSISEIAHLRDAVEAVASSYTTNNKNDEVMIQRYLQNVIFSGVAFTHEVATASPYRAISWSDGSDTSVVTAGRGGSIYHHAAASPYEAPEALKPVISLIEELETVFPDDPLDIEFAVTSDAAGEVLWLLQVRPLILSRPRESVQTQRRRLEDVGLAVSRSIGPHPFLLGSRTVYGVMPDWNPAEIIGLRPRPLALSLYRELITDSIWAYQRNNYGYRNLRSFPLMRHLMGVPYIDVRVSFNSFIPGDLDEELSSRLVDFYLNKLLESPFLHDKVEFEIVLSSFTFDLEQRLGDLRRAGFSLADTRQLSVSLTRLTNRLFDKAVSPINTDIERLGDLSSRRRALYQGTSDPIETIYWLLEDGKRYGTLPFAGLARAGFIAVQLLRSLVNVGVFSQDEVDAYMSSIRTVSSQISEDVKSLDKATFLGLYGHLRPGTYDILSDRYDEAPDRYFDWTSPRETTATSQLSDFELDPVKKRDIEARLIASGIDISVKELFEFIRSGVVMRERAKFEFSKNLSDALREITRLGQKLGYSRDDLSFADVTAFYDMYISGSRSPGDLEASIVMGRKRYSETSRISLPPLIAHESDVWSFVWPETTPNFITQGCVDGPVSTASSSQPLDGSIVFIPHADPGYDWIFAHGIVGLVTAWGGANSHMAIRAGEMGLPAVVGLGEQRFTELARAQRVSVDCANHRISALS
jgi:hypothetical protein